MAVISETLAKKSRRQTRTLDMNYKDLHAEKFDLKYCKYVLGFYSKASNFATIGELGRFPVYKSSAEFPTYFPHVNRYTKMVLDIGIVALKIL